MVGQRCPRPDVLALIGQTPTMVWQVIGGRGECGVCGGLGAPISLARRPAESSEEHNHWEHGQHIHTHASGISAGHVSGHPEKNIDACRELPVAENRPPPTQLGAGALRTLRNSYNGLITY